jgi:hypothetical protein
VTAPRIRRPRVFLAGIVLLAAVVVFGAWSVLGPKGTPIGWQLANLHSVGGPRGWDNLDEAKAATVVYLTTDWWPSCPQPRGRIPEGSRLKQMQLTSAFVAS